MLQSQRLRELRSKMKYTHEQLSQLLGISVRMVARYESGEVDPSSDVIVRMADTFHVTTDYLLGRSDVPNPYLTTDDLTEKERAVLVALRGGEPLEAIKAIVADL